MLSSLAQIHRIPFDAQLLLGQFPPPHRIESLISAAQGLGLKASLQTVAAKSLHRLVFPCLALLHPTPEEADASAAPATLPLALILQADGERLLCLTPGQTTPEVVTYQDFAMRYVWEGRGQA